MKKEYLKPEVADSDFYSKEAITGNNISLEEGMAAERNSNPGVDAGLSGGTGAETVPPGFWG